MAAEQARRAARQAGAPGRSRAARAAAGEGVCASRGILGLQRTRLLGATVALLAEDGYAGLSVAAVCARAGVSRRTFYEVFEDSEACFVALLREAERRARGLIAGLDLGQAAWQERVRMGLWALLCLADSDPALAKVCLVESQRAGGDVQRERERIFAELVEVLDQGRFSPGSASATGRLTAEGLVGAVSAVIATRLARLTEPERLGAERLRGLLGELAAMLVLPYLGPSAARRQAKRALPPVVVDEQRPLSGERADSLARVPIRLTYRTARVLSALAELADSETGASNRQLAERAGISDAGQISKLLWRLQERDLLENTAATGSHARGEANQWRLTPTGRQFVDSITTRTPFVLGAPRPVFARKAEQRKRFDGGGQVDV